MQPEVLAPSDTFARRHIGPSAAEVADMLAVLGYKSLDQLVDAIVPPGSDVSFADAGWTPPALSDTNLRRLPFGRRAASGY